MIKFINKTHYLYSTITLCIIQVTTNQQQFGHCNKFMTSNLEMSKLFVNTQFVHKKEKAFYVTIKPLSYNSF